MRDSAGVAIDSEDELCKIVGTDRVAVKDSQKLLGTCDICRQLTHRVNLQAVVRLFQSVLGHYFDHTPCFCYSAYKRNHDLDVRQTHHFARAPQRRTFKCEAIGVTWIVVARSPSEPKHRILFLRLE